MAGERAYEVPVGSAIARGYWEPTSGEWRRPRNLEIVPWKTEDAPEDLLAMAIETGSKDREGIESGPTFGSVEWFEDLASKCRRSLEPSGARKTPAEPLPDDAIEELTKLADLFNAQVVVSTATEAPSYAPDGADPAVWPTIRIELDAGTLVPGRPKEFNHSGPLAQSG